MQITRPITRKILFFRGFASSNTLRFRRRFAIIIKKKIRGEQDIYFRIIVWARGFLRVIEGVFRMKIRANLSKQKMTNL